MLKPHEERIIVEYKELKEKIDKLSEFFDKEAFLSLDKIDQYIISKQHHYMDDYLNILRYKIGRFEDKSFYEEIEKGVQ